jgi:DNA (cytosine-5)-methyltransferase 1
MSQGLHIADLFCGAGGTSTGCILAARELGLDITLLAINHWKIAVETHTRNHPWAQHLCADLGSVDPNRVVSGGVLRLLVASPECTHHSVARGGKPCNDQSRASAWHVLHWAERLRIEDILIENVGEFQTWGPLGRNGRPLKNRRGETFDAFLGALRSLGYTVDCRLLNAADYGDATTRRRLFIRATRRGKISWPEPSHMEKAFSLGQARWRAAREVIDWDLKGKSIFDRKRPLSRNTLRRIEAGLKRFGGEPFLAILRGTGNVRSVDVPAPAITAEGQHLGLCQPQPFVIQTDQTGGHGACVRSIEQPLYTAVTKQNMALVQPFILPNEGFFRGNAPRSVDQPVPTITAERGGGYLVEPFLVGYHGDKEATPRVHSVNDPLPTQTTENRFGLCEPFLTKYYGTASVRPVSEPLDTVTTKDRFALVEPVKQRQRMDIRFRMLQPHELAAAMGFDGYEFAGNKTEKVRQIGNAVPVNLAKALCKAILAS